MSLAPRTAILIVGVGGQGVISAARILGEAGVAAGVDAVLSQLHGMSQRGGSVESAVLLGPGGSALIQAGGADVVVALEPLEALRAQPRMSARTQVLVATDRVVPSAFAVQGRTYPDNDEILQRLRAVTPHVHPVDGARLLAEAGAPKALNMAMLGALGALGLLPFDPQTLRAAALARSNGRGATNGRAFDAGRTALDP